MIAENSQFSLVMEATEARMYERLWSLMDEGFARKYKAKALRVKGALLTMMGKSKSLQMNRVLNAGAQAEIERETIDEIIDCYKAANIKRFSFHVSPGPRSERIIEWLKKRRFELSGHYVKLGRPTLSPTMMETELTIKRIDKSHATSFAEILCENIAWPLSYVPWVASTVSQSGFYHFMAFSGDIPAATGVLYAEQTCGLVGWGATARSFRRRGAQSAIIAERVKRAAELGCEWVCSETLDPLPGRPATSYRNLIRNGFEPVYKRPIYLWESR